MVRGIKRFHRGAGLCLGATAALLGLAACGNKSTTPSGGSLQINVTPAATGLTSPIDATPDPMGTDIYFLATNADGVGVFHVAASGGAVDQVFVGAPLVDPHGISISSDGKTLYVADRAAGTSGGGAILSLPTSGDTPVVVSGTEGTHASALDVAESGATDEIYFTGTDMNGAPAVFEVPSEGGTLTTISSGAPFSKPDGVAVSQNDVFVADEKAGTMEPGAVFSLASGMASGLGPDVTPGNPMGIAVTLDGTRVLVSSLDPMAHTSEVTLIATKDGSATTFNDVIKVNDVSGGLHRARYKDIYAWAGKTQVYSIRIKILPIASSSIGGAGLN
jgi:hypothetical protein